MSIGAAVALPWPLPADTLGRVRAAGMDLGPMGTAEHYYANLDITVDGNPAMIQLAQHQQISLVHGPSGAKVDVSDTFDFGGV